MSAVFADLSSSHALETGLGPGVADIIIPVPLHPSKLRKRGYNQAELLSGMLAEILSITVSHRALLKINDTRPQMGLTREMRLENLKGSFAVVDKKHVLGKIVLLADDVMTTGATLEACAEELLRAGAAEVKAFTLARVI